MMRASPTIRECLRENEAVPMNALQNVVDYGVIDFY